MSRETREWLSTNVLVGFTEKRGNAWHYREGDDNHFEGPVPLDVVEKRLFDWHPVAVPETYTYQGRTYTSDDVVVIRSDNAYKLGTFAGNHVPHAYGEWLLANMAQIIDEDLAVGSAGLLKGGRIAWVQVEMPETMEAVGGVKIRPFLNAFGSLDGSFATTYKLGITNVVCDNTMRAAQGEKSPQVKIRSTVNAKKLFSAERTREALGIVFNVGEEFAAEVAELLATDFTNRQFEALTASLTAVPEDAGKRAQTLARSKADTLLSLWRDDERVAPWAGTAWGAYQALNTYDQHFVRVQGGNRAERNMLHSMSGKTDAADAKALEMILATA